MNKLLQTDSENIWHPFTRQWNKDTPILIERAEGVFIYSADGRKILDGVSSWWVNLFGHANKEIANAIAKQCAELEHVIFAGFTHKPAIELSKKLLSILPNNQKKIFFSDNGSTSIEVAIKMAFQYFYNNGKPRKKAIAIQGAYHGDTFGAMAVAERSIFSKPFDNLLFDVQFIPFPNEENNDEIIELFENIADKDTAFFIFEPLLQGTAGMRTYHFKTLDKLIQIAKKHDIICIADEVFTGFGRTGKYFASLHLQEQPDIFCLSKGITGGFMPLGVTTCSKKIVESFESEEVTKTFYHGHSYTANPLACAAAVASIKLLTSKEIQENIVSISESHAAFLNKIDKKNISKIYQIGTVFSIEIKTHQQTSYFNNLRDNMYYFFLSRDILLRPLGNVLYVVPPLTISKLELNLIYEAIDEFLTTL